MRALDKDTRMSQTDQPDIFRGYCNQLSKNLKVIDFIDYKQLTTDKYRMKTYVFNVYNL